MCLLIVLREVVPDWPLVVAANRDERYDRRGKLPRLLCENPRVFGGYDPSAGGTWLAVNQWAMVCAAANRPRQEPPVQPLRSRGLLCLDATRQKSCIAVADMVGSAVGRDNYNGFNLLCSTRAGGNLFYFDGNLREKPLRRGVFVITTGDANDLSIAKVRRVHESMGADQAPPHGGPISDWIERLETVCRDHGSDPGYPEASCMHGNEAGTVSSSILAFHARDPQQHLFRHCQGHPCEGTYETVPWPEGFFEPPAAAVPTH